MTSMGADLDKQAVDGFRLANKISHQCCTGEHAYTVMFALAALIASGLNQRSPLYSLEHAKGLHDDLINQIQAGTFDEQRAEALKDSE